MSQSIYKYIKDHFSDRPYEIDRIIVSAYFRAKNIDTVRNEFIRKYIIQRSKSELSNKVDKFQELIVQHFESLNIESIIELFEFVISPSDKIVTGAIYTPLAIRNYIVDKGISNSDTVDSNWKSADIACGCGGFLCTIAKKIKSKTPFSYYEIFKNNIYGLDIKSYSVRRSKILLTLLAISEGEDRPKFSFNIFQGNSLIFDWQKQVKSFSGFSFIAGNPPYVCSKRIDPKLKKQLERFEVCASGHPDLYIPFFQIGVSLLSPNGTLGYITMNTFFKSLNGRALRAYFQRLQLSFSILDFGTTQVFKKKNTYTCICIITNTPCLAINYSRITSTEKLLADIAYEQIDYDKLNAQNGWNLHNNEILSKIENVGTPFSEKYTTRNGIATLKNEIFIFKPVREDRDHYYLQNGKIYPIEKEVCKDVVNPNFLSSNDNLDEFIEKLIFPYYFEQDKAKLITGREFSERYPNAFKYLNEKKIILSERDKGNGDYEKWFAFGRTQSLERRKYKLFFPHITASTPSYQISENSELFFYNGIAVIGETIEELQVLTKIMSSSIFWFYIKNSSKPYSADYYSLSKNYIKDFGICDFLPEEREYVLKEQDKNSLNEFFLKKYNVEI